MDGGALKKKHPTTTVASEPRKTSGMAVGNDKRNGLRRRATGKRRVNWRQLRYFKRGSRASID
jgi:hypothetical protein